jgi:hypothetical protein
MSTTTSLFRTGAAVGLLAAAALSPSTAQAQTADDSPLLNHATHARWGPPVFGLGTAVALDGSPDRVSGEVALLARVPEVQLLPGALPSRGSRSRPITGESAMLGRVD